MSEALSSENSDLATPTQGAEDSDLYSLLCQEFEEQFGNNKSVAMIVLLASLVRRLSVQVQGPSSAGKTMLGQRVLDLLPENLACFVSRMSEELELHPDCAVIFADALAWNGAIRAMMLKLEAGSLAVGGNGSKNRQGPKGPVAIIHTTLPGDDLEVYDASRLLIVQMSEEAGDYHANAIKALAGFYPGGPGDSDRWKKCKLAIASLILSRKFSSLPLLKVASSRLVPEAAPARLARRLQQLIFLAASIRVLRNHGQPKEEPIGEADVKSALDLLDGARVLDDYEELPHRTRRLLKLLVILRNWDVAGDAISGQATGQGMSMEQLLEELNTKWADTAKEIADAGKRHVTGPANGFSLPPLTRRIIRRHLEILRNRNLVNFETWRGAQLWRPTTTGITCVRAGGMNSFRLIRSQLERSSEG